MLSNRQPLSSLFAGIFAGASSAMLLTPNLGFAVIIGLASALLCLSSTSEKKVIIFLAGGVTATMAAFIVTSHFTILNQVIAIVSAIACSLYLTSVLSK